MKKRSKVKLIAAVMISIVGIGAAKAGFISKILPAVASHWIVTVVVEKVGEIASTIAEAITNGRVDNVDKANPIGDFPTSKEDKADKLNSAKKQSSDHAKTH